MFVCTGKWVGIVGIKWWIGVLDAERWWVRGWVCFYDGSQADGMVL